jgi:hypothetical protein
MAFVRAQEVEPYSWTGEEMCGGHCPQYFKNYFTFNHAPDTWQGY